MPLLANHRHEHFAELVASGKSGAAAYRETYRAQGTSAEAGASRLLRNVEVKRRVEELQAKSADAAVMALDEQRRLLAAVARGEHAGAKISDRLRAIEIDARLAGYLNTKGANQSTVMNGVFVAPPDSFNRGMVMTEERRAELVAKKRELTERHLRERSDSECVGRSLTLRSQSGRSVA